eukprot:GHUV01030751.1.p2 GENE.GHUV01030751.1~~GHUV01030751.1.p2  ORF type:complete len:127 (-),score=39.95 GHUV01030751.1:218-598(-)
MVLVLNKPCSTGDRKGNIMCWDLGSGSSSWGVSAAHEGHITALTWQHSASRQQLQQQQDTAGSNCVISGGQDGCVRVWDGRSGDFVAEQAVHVDKRGKGAVGNIIAGKAEGAAVWSSALLQVCNWH